MSEVGHHSPGDSSRLVYLNHLKRNQTTEFSNGVVFRYDYRQIPAKKKKKRKKETSLEGGTESVENNYRLPARPGWSSEVKKAHGLAHQL